MYPGLARNETRSTKRRGSSDMMVITRGARHAASVLPPVPGKRASGAAVAVKKRMNLFKPCVQSRERFGLGEWFPVAQLLGLRQPVVDQHGYFGPRRRLQAARK